MKTTIVRSVLMLEEPRRANFLTFEITLSLDSLLSQQVLCPLSQWSTQQLRQWNREARLWSIEEQGRYISLEQFAKRPFPDAIFDQLL
ncbi:hypothetical protein D3C76_764090 [compost metagenome]